MLEKIDNFFLAVARKIIDVAAFFGITRRQLIYWHTTFSSMIIFQHVKNTENLTFTYILIPTIVGLIFAKLIILPEALECYRDDEILECNPLLTSRQFRLFFLFAFYAISLGVFKLEQWQNLFFAIVVIKILLPIYLWSYFILN